MSRRSSMHGQRGDNVVTIDPGVCEYQHEGIPVQH